MVRNLKTEKCRPPRPTRCCRKKTGPGETRNVITVIASAAAASSGRASRAQMMSPARFHAGIDGGISCMPARKSTFAGEDARFKVCMNGCWNRGRTRFGSQRELDAERRQEAVWRFPSDNAAKKSPTDAAGDLKVQVITPPVSEASLS